MNKLLKSYKTRPVIAYREKVEYVQPDLAVTPSEMLSMSERGIAISSQMNDKDFYDGDINNNFNIDPLLCRGVDINDAWNMQRDAVSKLDKYRKTSRPLNNINNNSDNV
ncbi:hypothetical protein [Dipodfec virus UOA04_Rod_698]|nr:hypothetical protein [Dipodfec virus UOA04_Rod_698]